MRVPAPGEPQEDTVIDFAPVTFTPATDPPNFATTMDVPFEHADPEQTKPRNDVPNE